MKLLSIVSARPNFVKLAAIHHALAARSRADVLHRIVHTGQHFDPLFSDVFFHELGIPVPDVNLGIHGSSNDEQQDNVQRALIPLLQQEHPEYVLVYGDVNGAAAAARVAASLGIPVAHIEAGLRSFDDTMPEERNRIAIDQRASLLFVTEQAGVDNLRGEGITNGVHLVGNTMIDTLVRMLPRIRAVTLPPLPERFALVTMHRPSNVDDAARLTQIMQFLERLSAHVPVVFPLHRRTQKNLDTFGIRIASTHILLIEPQPYLSFLAMIEHAAFVLTDSGGIQEEATFLRRKCFTLRPNTERPCTIEIGSNELIDLADAASVFAYADHPNEAQRFAVPPLWDGRAGERIVDILLT